MATSPITQVINTRINNIRVNPSKVPKEFQGYLESDQAQINFAYTIFNDDDSLQPLTTDNTNYFLTDYEPWLYDRSTAIYVG